MNGTEYRYLLEGEEKALLIDADYGAGNLGAFVEKLTDKPVIVKNTPFHPDYSLGNAEFEKAYVTAGCGIDAPSIYSPGAVPFTLSKLPYLDYENIIIGDGYESDLGGRMVEVLDVFSKEVHHGKN